MKKESKIITMGLVVLVVAILVVSSNPSFTSFFTQSTDSIILRPNRDLYGRKVIYSGGTTFYNSVNEITMDGDNSNVQFEWSGNLGEQQRLVFGLGQLERNLTINKIIVHYFIREDADGGNNPSFSLVRPYLTFEASEFTIGDDWLTSRGYAHNYTAINFTYREYTDTWSINPKTNQPWAVSDINHLNIGIETKGEGYKLLTQIYVEIQPSVKPTTTNQPAPQTPGFELITLVIAIGIAMILLRRRKK